MNKPEKKLNIYERAYNTWARANGCDWPSVVRDESATINLLYKPFIVDRACDLSGPFPRLAHEGVENAIVGVIHSPVETVTASPEMAGLAVLPLPYALGGDTPVMVFPEGPGAGTEAFLRACLYMPAWEFAYALSWRMSQDFEVVVRPGNNRDVCLALRPATREIHV